MSTVTAALKLPSEFEQEIGLLGCSLFEGVVPGFLLEGLRRDMCAREKICREWQVRNGVEGSMAGVAHHVVGGSDSFAEFLSNLFLDGYIQQYFSGPYILNSYGVVNNMPGSESGYAHGARFHRDVRTYSGSFRLMLNMLVMIDEFTVQNGATKLVHGSHQIQDRPSDEFLERHTARAVGKAGSILLFDSNVWHSSAPNLSDGPRRALTLTFTRPFFKQQMDYPRLLGESYTDDERLRQVLGYNSRVPVGYNEWYQPPERRMYKPGQG
nr:phytanoyl-CoA dioxygenase family protein [Dyella sp. ASV24]